MKLLTIFLFFLCVISQAEAQSSVPGATPPDISGWIKFWDRARSDEYSKYDKQYEKGKAIYDGRSGHQKYHYCLLSDDSTAPLIKLNRKTIRAYRGVEVKTFIKALYDCADPEVNVLTRLTGENAGLVVYYLHKRYRLKLNQDPVPTRKVEKQKVSKNKAKKQE